MRRLLKFAVLFGIAGGMWAYNAMATSVRPRPRPIPPPLMQLSDSAALPIQLVSLKIEGQMTGHLAKTTLELVFRNPNARVLEGELQFPLLDGQQVTGFALDIDGHLRPAVPVEKAKGQEVFEEVIRTRVDPALLEVTQGNNFKLRVYPLPAKGERRVSLTLMERMPTDKSGAALYRLALPASEQLDVLDVRLRSSGVVVDKSKVLSGLPGAEWWQREGEAKLEFRREKLKPEERIEVLLAVPPNPQVVVEQKDNTSYFYAELPPMAFKPTQRPVPSRVALLWDASGSGEKREKARELMLLDAWFKAVQNTEVVLTLARDAAEDKGRFQIKKGDWSTLRKVLEEVIYDGATSALAFRPASPVDAVLLFSDGLVNFGSPGFPQFSVPVLAINASASADLNRLRFVADNSGGVFVDLMSMEPEEAARSLREASPRVVALRAVGAKELVRSWSASASGGLAVAGILTAPSTDMEVEWLLPDGKREKQSFKVETTKATGEFAAQEWARLKVAMLEAEYELNRSQIQRLGKTFGLVTRNTSLIVLDRVEDYVRYEIVPPAELLAEYERQIGRVRKQAEQSKAVHVERVLSQFNEKLRWWERDFSKERPHREKKKAEREPTTGSAETERFSMRRGVGSAETDGAVMGKRIGARADSRRTRSERMPEAAPPASMARPPARMAQPAPRMARPPASAEYEGESQQLSGSALSSVVAERSASPAPAQATIQLKKWESNAPYVQRLKKASKAQLYSIYLDERPDYLNSTAFFLDVADIFFDKGETALALRVLSNLAEMNLESRHILRVLSYRLLQAGRADLAVWLLERVLELSPNEPQSWRDLGLAWAKLGEMQKAVDNLYEVVSRPWHGRFPGIELIALGELNAIVATAKTKPNTSAMDKRLLRNLPVDLRVVLSWDSDNTDIDLWVTDPNGEKTYYSNPLSFQGGRLSADFTGGYGPEEFLLKKAKPGKYLVQAQFYGHRQQTVSGATSLQLNFFTGFGTPRQKEQPITLRLQSQGDMVSIGEFEVK
ncbi:MAG: tetratricopeptide repeat protein [Cystobacterineae bacterium]|nr:tetratricopeptide repeat protein [Cystobacterineae bacterium]